MAQVKRWEAKFSHKVIYTIVIVLVTLLLVGGGFYVYNFFTHDTQTVLQNNPGKEITSTIATNKQGTAHFTETNFSFDLPADWKKTGELATGPYHMYSYQATMKNADNRFLKIYIDTLPLDLSVNKVVALTANGAKLSHGEVSDNCANFTQQTTPKQLKIQAKWDGVNFYCNMQGTNENIAGTSSAQAINSVTLQAAGSVKHSFFFEYEDDNYTPDYGILYGVLDSFQVK